VWLSFYLAHPRYEASYLHNPLMIVVGFSAIGFHICGLPLVFVVRRYVSWCLMGLVYVLPLAALCSFGPITLAGMHQSVTPGFVTNLILNFKVFGLLALVWAISGPLDLSRMRRLITNKS